MNLANLSANGQITLVGDRGALRDTEVIPPVYTVRRELRPVSKTNAEIEAALREACTGTPS